MSMSYGHEAPGYRAKCRWSDAQLAAIALFESEFGEASHVPPGPRRTSFFAKAYVTDPVEQATVAMVQSDRSYARPKVLLVWPDGSSVRADIEAWT